MAFGVALTAKTVVATTPAPPAQVKIVDPLRLANSFEAFNNLFISLTLRGLVENKKRKDQHPDSNRTGHPTRYLLPKANCHPFIIRLAIFANIKERAIAGSIFNVLNDLH